MSKEKRLTLNAEKRNAIANVFQSHWEREDSPVMQSYNKAKENYNQVREHMKKFVEVIVRKYQPEEDVETIRAMSNKYGDSGGQLYHDNCFRFQHDYEKVDHEGNITNDYDTCNIDFGLDGGKSYKILDMLIIEMR